MDNKTIPANKDNDLMFRAGLINQQNKQKKVDELLKNGSNPITEDVENDEPVQYFTD